MNHVVDVVMAFALFAFAMWTGWCFLAGKQLSSELITLACFWSFGTASVNLLDKVKREGQVATSKS